MSGGYGFIGLGKKPTPLPASDVDNILKRTEETQVKPSPKVMFEKESKSELMKALL